MKSKVYFIKTAENSIKGRIECLRKLLKTIVPFAGCHKDSFIPIKITLGDTKCVYNIHPELIKTVISEAKEKNLKPFLFDTNVIYKGSRMNAVDHLALAQNKGFAYSKVGAPFIIADGIFGHDGKEYKIDSEYIKKIKIPSFIGMVDNLIVLSHITSHILSGYAGAVKNIAMGMVSKATKQIQHSSLKPSIIKQKCTSCGCCIEICPVHAITFSEDKKTSINPSKCIGCGECLCACKFDAVLINWHEDKDIFSKRMIDVAQFILSKFKNKLFINFGFDITKECDCISTKNEPIISKNIGILASKDILSLERATIGLIDKENLQNQSYKKFLEYAREKNIGSSEYDLIEI